MFVLSKVFRFLIECIIAETTIYFTYSDSFKTYTADETEQKGFVLYKWIHCKEIRSRIIEKFIEISKYNKIIS